MSECPVNKILAEAEGDLRKAQESADAAMHTAGLAILNVIMAREDLAYSRGRRDAIAEAQATRDAEIFDHDGE